MKKFLSAISLSVCCVLFTLFCGCQTVKIEEGDVTLLENDSTVVIRVEKTVSGGSLFDALTFLNVDFTYGEGSYGAYLVSVNGVTPQEGQFWAIYTTLAEHEGVTYSSAQYGTYAYGEKTLASASYGCSYLPLIEGAYYLLALGNY